MVGVFLGTQSSGGFQANVLEALREGTGAKIRWEDVRPGPKCVVTTVITRPFALIAVQRVEGAVTFAAQVRTKNCP